LGSGPLRLRPGAGGVRWSHQRCGRKKGSITAPNRRPVRGHQQGPGRREARSSSSTTFACRLTVQSWAGRSGPEAHAAQGPSAPIAWRSPPPGAQAVPLRHPAPPADHRRPFQLALAVRGTPAPPAAARVMFSGGRAGRRYAGVSACLRRGVRRSGHRRRRRPRGQAASCRAFWRLTSWRERQRRRWMRRRPASRSVDRQGRRRKYAVGQRVAGWAASKLQGWARKRQRPASSGPRRPVSFAPPSCKLGARSKVFDGQLQIAPPPPMPISNWACGWLVPEAIVQLPSHQHHHERPRRTAYQWRWSAPVGAGADHRRSKDLGRVGPGFWSGPLRLGA